MRELIDEKVNDDYTFVLHSFGKIKSVLKRAYNFGYVSSHYLII